VLLKVLYFISAPFERFTLPNWQTKSICLYPLPLPERCGYSHRGGRWFRRCGSKYWFYSRTVRTQTTRWV